MKFRRPFLFRRPFPSKATKIWVKQALERAYCRAGEHAQTAPPERRSSIMMANSILGSIEGMVGIFEGSKEQAEIESAFLIGLGEHKTCAVCNRVYLLEERESLKFAGTMEDGAIELRDCACGNTLGWDMEHKK